MKSGVSLRPGENLVMELEAELWATSSHIVARFFGTLRRLLNLLLGVKVSTYIVITDQRVIEVRDRKACWCFNVARDRRYLMPSSIKECGYAKVGTVCGCFCQAYIFYYEAWTQSTAILLKGVDEYGARQVVDAFYYALTNTKVK